MFNIKRVFSPGSRRKMLYLLIALVLLVLLDGLITEYLMDGGGAKEANPFLEPLVGQTGFMILKAVGALLVAVILWDVYRRFPRVAVIAAWIAVAGYLGIVLWNTSLVFLV
jgi:hypothetical protein